MIKVNLFDEDFILDKKIVVFLDGGLDIFDFDCFDGIEEYDYAFTWGDLCRCIKNKKPLIITPLTSIITEQVMELRL